MKTITITLYDLPKISLNEWYSGNHWSKRKQIKDNYSLIIKNQFKDVLSREFEYVVNYMFYFKNKPLDASNCVAMTKLIEDILFESDKFDIVRQIKLSSSRSVVKNDFVFIEIQQFEKNGKEHSSP